MKRMFFAAVGALMMAGLGMGTASAQTGSDWNGFYIGLHGGYNSGQVEGEYDSFKHSNEGAAIGILGGYNRAVGDWLVGAEADFTYFIDNNDGGWEGGGRGPHFETELDYMLSLRARLGYPMGKFLPYGTVGVGWLEADTTVGGCCSGDSSHFGIMYGAGVEYMLTDNLSLRGEYIRGVFDGDEAFPYFDVQPKTNVVRLGLIWRFAEPKPAPKPMPVAKPKPMPKPKPKPVAKPKPKPAPPPPPRSFIVFFDWDKSNIRADAQRVIEAATAYAKRRGFVRVNLAGHADRSGSAKYNMGLSLRRAAAVKAAFVKLGFSAGQISTVGRGESDPLVSTADGVREPRNRRVEIAF